MRNSLFLAIFIVFSSLASGQEKQLTCLDFNKGQFKNNDSHSNYTSTILRSGGKQLEIADGVESYKKIHWFNDCDYTLYFLNSEARKDKFKKFINRNGGIQVQMTKIEGNTIHYKSSYFDGKKDIVTEGTMVKISKNGDFN